MGLCKLCLIWASVQVEALLQLQRPTDALRELLLVGDRHPDYATTPEYRSLLYQVQR